MNEHKYTLEPYGNGKNTRHTCPSCKKNRCLTFYIDTETGQPLPPNVGKCNRLSNCGYHYTPKQYFQDNPEPVKCYLMKFEKLEDFSAKAYKASDKGGTYFIPKSQVLEQTENGYWISEWFLESSKLPFIANECKYFDRNENPLPQPTRIAHPAPSRPKLVSVIPDEMVKASLQQQFYQANNFVKFLTGLFGVEITQQLICTYFVGTSKHWPGATVFWQVDCKSKARTGKIMLYSPITGKRVKELFDHITWVHSALNQPDFELQQCLFGEHLLQDKTKPVAIVESEKTAIIASVYLPQFIWLAAGGNNGLNAEKCRILAGRTGVLFPDLKMFEAWNSKVKEIPHLARFKVSDLLELKATETERTAGLDLADYLLRFDYRKFRHQEPMPSEATLQPMQPEPPFQPVMKPIEPPEPMVRKPQLANWQPEIAELKTYFKSITLPGEPVKLNPSEMILNMVKFIDGHLAVVEANNGKPTFLPYLERLQELKQKLTINLN